MKPIHPTIKTVFYTLLLSVYSFFAYLMWDITAQYIPYDTDVAFLGIKQDEIALDYYRIAFFTHVYTSMLVLLAAFTQFSGYITRKMPLVHKVGGWIYVVVIVLFSGPSGLIMGYHANGGWTSQLAFCILAILWMYFTVIAIWKAKQKDMKAHRRFMYYSFALTLSAITLRLWKYILVALFMPRPMDVYRVVAWLGWIGNLIIAEIILYRIHKKSSIS